MITHEKKWIVRKQHNPNGSTSYIVFDPDKTYTFKSGEDKYEVNPAPVYNYDNEEDAKKFLCDGDEILDEEEYSIGIKKL